MNERMVRAKEVFKRYGMLWVVAGLLFSCGNNQESSGDRSSRLDSLEYTTDQQSTPINKDTLILELTNEILTVFKEKEYQRLVEFFHPTLGVRFSPYGYVDTTSHLAFSASSFQEAIEEDTSQIWGRYDGTGDDILLTPTDYFEKFVYDVDFLDAEETSVNRFLGKGNTLNNLRTIYPGSEFSESYFSGFEAKYGGMDWRSLRLVFRPHEGELYLVAVIHDQWTI